jgi:acetylornithine deacetylase/succinyl-diaminopimelate desuccinylase-like protein
MDVKKLCELIDERQNELYDILCELIRVNSESFGSTGNEKELAYYVHGLCNKLELMGEVYSPISLSGFTECEDYMDGRNLEERYNTSAVWKGKEDVNGLMLMGHLDTVQIGDIKNWSFPPLEGIVKDGKIFGRGACDDKYALATALFVIRVLKDAGFEPKKNLVFSAYSDEEHGGSHGAMAATMKYPCERIVNMDGRQNEIWNCASGGGEVVYRFKAKEAKDSALAAASAFPTVFEVIGEFAERRRAELEQNRFYKGTSIPLTSLRYMEVRAGKDGMDLGEGYIKFVFYTDKTRNEIYSEFEEMEKKLSKLLEELGFVGGKFTPATRFFHYGFAEPDSDAISDMIAAAKEATGEDVTVCGSCLSDLSVILKYGGKSAFAFGAGRDFSLPGGAHQPNEFIECDRLLAFSKTIAAYILKVLG